MYAHLAFLVQKALLFASLLQSNTDLRPPPGSGPATPRRASELPLLLGGSALAAALSAATQAPRGSEGDFQAERLPARAAARLPQAGGECLGFTYSRLTRRSRAPRPGSTGTNHRAATRPWATSDKGAAYRSAGAAPSVFISDGIGLQGSRGNGTCQLVGGQRLFSRWLTRLSLLKTPCEEAIPAAPDCWLPPLSGAQRRAVILLCPPLSLCGWPERFPAVTTGWAGSPSAAPRGFGGSPAYAGASLAVSAASAAHWLAGPSVAVGRARRAERCSARRSHSSRPAAGSHRPSMSAASA